ncbi:MAG: hypothetical protein ABFS56_21715 [Pseudomonadota bacterium]
MKLILFPVLAAAISNFSSQSGTLRIPEVSVDEEIHFYNVELQLDFATADFKLKRFTAHQPVNAQLAAPFNLFVGQSAILDALEIQFVAIQEDSRCPTDVVCVWAGNVIVVLQVYQEQQQAVEVLLNTNSVVGPTAVKFDKYRLELKKVRPEPISTQAISEYEITLVVTGRD